MGTSQHAKEQSPPEQATLSVNNIGGIDETKVSFEQGVTVLSGRNATNRTSLLQGIMAALGSDQASLKADSKEGQATLEFGEETYQQTLHRRGGAIVTEGDSYLDDPEVADLFAFLLESNEARQAVARGDDLRDLIMRPVDTDAIKAEIQQLEQRKNQIDNELEELDDLENQLPDLEAKRTRLIDEIEELRDELETAEEELEAANTDIETRREERSELEVKFDELRDTRSELELVRNRIETERESIEALENEREDVEANTSKSCRRVENRISVVSKLKSIRSRQRKTSSTKKFPSFSGRSSSTNSCWRILESSWEAERIAMRVPLPISYSPMLIQRPSRVGPVVPLSPLIKSKPRSNSSSLYTRTGSTSVRRSTTNSRRNERRSTKSRRIAPSISEPIAASSRSARKSNAGVTASGILQTIEKPSQRKLLSSRLRSTTSRPTTPRTSSNNTAKSTSSSSRLNARKASVTMSKTKSRQSKNDSMTVKGFRIAVRRQLKS